MRHIILLLMTLIFGGCVSRAPINGKEIEVTNHESVYTQSRAISATAPNNFPDKPFIGYTRFDYDAIFFERQLPNLGENVEISTYIPNQRINIDDLLNKKDSDNLENNLKKPPGEWEKKNLKERGVTYNKYYVDYIDGLKCTTNVEASSIAQDVGYKKYYTVCGYYDNQGNKKRLDISYYYTFTYGMTRFEAQEEMKNGKVFPTSQEMQMQFKQDMKSIFDSLKIHDMDRIRMKKQGLLHEKKYTIPKW